MGGLGWAVGRSEFGILFNSLGVIGEETVGAVVWEVLDASAGNWDSERLVSSTFLRMAFLNGFFLPFWPRLRPEGSW